MMTRTRTTTTHRSRQQLGVLLTCVLVVALLCPAAAGASQGATLDRQQARVVKAYSSMKRSTFRKAPDLEVADVLAAARSQQVVFVDVRTFDERAVSTIPGALSGDQFEDQMFRFRDAVVVVYDTVGLRSGIYTEELRRRNVNAYTLAGGVLAWAFAGQPFADALGETSRVHVHDKRWRVLPAGYESTW